MPWASSRRPRSLSRLASFWLANRRRCSYAISQPCTTLRASGPQPLSFRCRRICSAISSHDRRARGDLIRSDLTTGGNGAPPRTRMLTLILLKYLYNVSGACAGVLPPIFGADTRQSRRLAACPRRFSAAHYPPAARESWLARDRLGRGRQIAASGWKTYVGFYS